MLLVETRLARSPIHGIGLFAAQAIPVGTPIWKMDRRIDLILYELDLEEMPPVTRGFLNHYTYRCRRNNVWVLCGDDGRFFNHAEEPNTKEDYTVPCPFGIDLAARDIADGEELTTDYRGFDDAMDVKFVK